MKISIVTRRYCTDDPDDPEVYGMLGLVDGHPYCYTVYRQDYKVTDDRDEQRLEPFTSEEGEHIPRHLFRQIMVGTAAYNYLRMEYAGNHGDSKMLEAVKEGLKSNPIECAPFRVDKIRSLYQLVGAPDPDIPDSGDVHRWLSDFQNGQFIRGTVITIRGLTRDLEVNVEGVTTF